jgi:hypothetical protein
MCTIKLFDLSNLEATDSITAEREQHVEAMTPVTEHRGLWYYSVRLTKKYSECGQVTKSLEPKKRDAVASGNGKPSFLKHS